MQTVKVRLRKPTRVFTFLVDDIPLQRNENCIVRSDRGLEFGTCVLPPEPCPDHQRQRYKMSVVRKVTHQDQINFNHLQMEEARAKEICEQRIRERNLPMKLVDAEYTFDKHKIVFYFTADDRVDFRQLVRDLAQELKTRIELRHIQVRDEAKIVGGIGVCGRELCCSTWLREFKPISMKMAKRQNLSLNPSKISGQCGRLLCCLSYENEMYQERRRGEVAARREEPQEEKVPAVALGREGAFAFSEIRHRPPDWRERLQEMTDDEPIPSDLDEFEEEPSAVVEFMDETSGTEDEPKTGRAPERSEVGPDRERGPDHGAPRRRGRRRRRRRGGPPSGGAGQGNPN